MSTRFAGTVLTLLIFFVFLVYGCVPAPPPAAVPEDEDTPPIVMALPPDSEVNEPSGIYNTTRGKHYPTIQKAIDDSREGDVIEVQPGTYYENIRFTSSHPKITVKGTATFSIFHFGRFFDEVRKTVIDARGQDRVVLFDGNDSTLQGFTIKGGLSNDSNYFTGGGGGIKVRNGSKATITKNVITDNTGRWGGGIRIYGADPTISYNEVSDNKGSYGSGINVEYSDATSIYGNLIRDNPPRISAHRGGGIWVQDCNITIANNTITGNSASAGGGIYVNAGTAPATVTISNNTITGNEASTYIQLEHRRGGGIWMRAKEDAILTGNTVKDNDPDDIHHHYYP